MWMQLSIYLELEFSRSGIKNEALRILLLRRNHDSKDTEYYWSHFRKRKKTKEVRESEIVGLLKQDNALYHRYYLKPHPSGGL